MDFLTAEQLEHFNAAASAAAEATYQRHTGEATFICPNCGFTATVRRDAFCGVAVCDHCGVIMERK